MVWPQNSICEVALWSFRYRMASVRSRCSCCMTFGTQDRIRTIGHVTVIARPLYDPLTETLRYYELLEALWCFVAASWHPCGACMVSLWWPSAIWSHEPYDCCAVIVTCVTTTIPTRKTIRFLEIKSINHRLQNNKATVQQQHDWWPRQYTFEHCHIHLDQSQSFSFKKMHLNMPSAKWQPFYLIPNVLSPCHNQSQSWFHQCFRVKYVSYANIFGVPSRHCSLIEFCPMSDILTCKWLGHFYQNVTLFSYDFYNKCNIL